MMSQFDYRCGCDNPCAITKPQRAYAKRALTMAYTMRDRLAIAKIKDALAPCPKRDTSRAEFENIAALTLINAMQGATR